jgi:Histidine kinase
LGQIRRTQPTTKRTIGKVTSSNNHPKIAMSLPPKVQTAIELLREYDIGTKTVAPFWYRQYLRFQPDTPPPLFGGSRGYWTFRTFQIALGGDIFWILTSIMIASLFASPEEKWLFWTPLRQLAYWTFAPFVALMITSEMQDRLRKERDRLSLPVWQHFSSDWQPQSAQAKARATLDHFWLRGIRDEPLFVYGGFAGLVTFVLIATLIPYEAVTFGTAVAFTYSVICVFALRESNRLRIMPGRTVVWPFLSGLLLGVVLASVCWSTGYAWWAGYPTNTNNVTLVFLVSILFMYLLDTRAYELQRRTAIRIEHAEQAKQLAEVRLHALKAQIEPHFIFNTIAHLKSMIATDPKLAERMADELSDFLRASLAVLRKDWSTVGEELQLARAYLEIAKLRMGSRLSSHVQISEGVAHVRIPPLLIQTLLENAIQHGVEPSAAPCEIQVSADMVTRDDQSPFLLIRVVDTGVGFGVGNTGGAGVGLANVRERLTSAYAGRAKLSLTPNTPSGVVAKIELPVEKRDS